MATPKYLTIRCPLGCETWLTPRAFDGHMERGRCLGHPWVDDVPDQAVVPAPLAGVLLPVLPDSVVKQAERPTIDRAKRERFSLDFREGYCIRSPLDGVPARRWLRLAVAALECRGLSAVREALEADGFAALESELIEPGSDTRCPDCGEWMTVRGLPAHQSRSAACRWRRAAREVRDAWEAGWRDPFNVPDAPLTWAQLTAKIHWKRRLLTVEFPRWYAVLLKP